MIIAEGLERYRPNVGVCLFNTSGQVWIGERCGTGKHEPHKIFRWQMPQGGIDEGETVATAARRELYEETGVRSARLLAVTPGWLAYDFPEEYRKRKWRGQRQKWVAMLFEGEESEIDLDAHEEREFEDWRWASLGEAVSLVVPFKRTVYEELSESFEPLADFIATCR